MPRLFIALFITLSTSTIGLTPAFLTPIAAGQDAWSAPPVTNAVSVRDGRTGEAIALDAFLDAISKADVVFLGETHDDETTHRFELAVYEGLLQRRAGNVVLAMEMFERNAQDDLDLYLAGEIDEAAFLSRVHPWPNYRTGYRPLIERAKAAGQPVVASNFPRRLRRSVAMQGGAALEALEGDARRQAPAELFPNTEAYWRRVDNAVRGHRDMMGGGGDDDGRLYSVQSLWDNSMGESCALAMDDHPGSLVLHVNGGFHSLYWDGTLRQLRLRKPDASVVSVAIWPVANPAVEDVSGATAADYVVFAEARAADVYEDAWSVYVQRPEKYRLHLPEVGPDDAATPLLIWLGDDGLRASDGLDLWMDRLGDEAAIAVLEPPYREVAPDLSEGGRWFWPDTFASDVAAMQTSVERVWAYLLRHYPIDPDRVCLAGEGTGATIAAAVTLLTDRVPVESVALLPRRYAKIKDFPLPLPEFRGDDPPVDKSLGIVIPAEDQDWWKGELAEYQQIGFANTLHTPTDDPWQIELQSENSLRVALGLPRLPAPPDATQAERRFIVADENSSPRARYWARLRALRSAAAEDGPVAVVTVPPAEASAVQVFSDIRPESVVSSGAIPLCPGPFGGTTVLVLPEGTTPEDAQAWLALEEDDPLTRRSRFHRVRIATTQGERSLPDVLTTLRAANRTNALIIPATFCADAATMQSLHRSVRGMEDQMTLHWLPGLGGGSS